MSSRRPYPPPRFSCSNGNVLLYELQQLWLLWHRWQISQEEIRGWLRHCAEEVKDITWTNVSSTHGNIWTPNKNAMVLWHYINICSIQVPFGPLAFMPGHLIHTNEILVLLGDNWFAEMSAVQACDVIDRRLKGNKIFWIKDTWFIILISYIIDQ